MKKIFKYVGLKLIPAKKREYWAISLFNSIGYGETSLESEVNNFFSKITAQQMGKFGILDIGASKGEWAELALKKHANAVIYCFEPQVESMKISSAKLQDFIKNGRCKTHNYALGNKKIITTLYSDIIGAGSASLFRKKIKIINMKRKSKLEISKLK